MSSKKVLLLTYLQQEQELLVDYFRHAQLLFGYRGTGSYATRTNPPPNYRLQLCQIGPFGSTFGSQVLQVQLYSSSLDVCTSLEDHPNDMAP